MISGVRDAHLGVATLCFPVYRIAPEDGRFAQVITDLAAPNGLAFSPDEKILYVVESHATPHRLIWAYDVDAESRLLNKRIAVDASSTEREHRRRSDD